MLCVLCVVDDAVAAGLGAAVGLHHEHAVFRHIQHHLRVEHGRGADGHPQLTQTILAAAHHIVVERVHNDRHHRHGLTGHPLYLFIEVADVAADVQRPAGMGPGEQADESAQMEHRQHHVVTGQGLCQIDLVCQLCGDGPQHMTCAEQVALAHHNALAQAGGAGGEHQHHQVITDLGVGTHHREEILLAQHHALAAARGTGGEHQDHQGFVVDAAGQLRRLIAAEAIHGAEDIAVGSLELVVEAVVVAVGQDGVRLHKAQLIAQLVPALALVQQHQHRTGRHHAKGVHGILVAVLGEQADLFALDLRDCGLEVIHRLADILHIILIEDGGHGIVCGVVEAEGHIILEAVFHVDGDKVVDIIQHSDLTHCSVSSCVQRSSFPMALRGSGCALNSVTMRLYSGRPRLTPVTNSFTASCFAGSQ